MRRLVLALLAAGVSLPAQYALSAMAGYIHYTEGEVWPGDRAIAPKPEDFEHLLEGRRLRTGQGKAEEPAVSAGQAKKVQDWERRLEEIPAQLQQLRKSGL